MIYPATDQYIDLAHNALENGEVIVYPTDTLYGFGVDATNTDAIHRLNRLKGRIKPLSIVLESVEHIHDFAEFTGEIEIEVNNLFQALILFCSRLRAMNFHPLCKMVLPISV